MNKDKINIQGTEILVVSKQNEDFISITDIARFKNPHEPKDVVKNWMRNKNTIEFLGLWEKLNNPDFKGVEFDPIKNEAGLNSFTMSPSRWIKLTNAKGIVVAQGRNGGTLAHKDIAFEFASWISSEFKLYLLKEFQRLKIEESNSKKLEWSVSRTIAKLNYRVHTDAIKEHLIPEDISKREVSFVYAGEADLLNLALFGVTALEWRRNNPDNKGNIRDYATLEQLVVLSNLESFNSEMIKDGIKPEIRLNKLNKIAISQMKIMIESKSIKQLK